MSSFTFHADFAVKDKIKLWDFGVGKRGCWGQEDRPKSLWKLFKNTFFAEGRAITVCNKQCAVLPKQLSDFPFGVQDEPSGKFNSSPNYQWHLFNDRIVGWNNFSFVRIATFLIIKDGYELCFKDHQKLSKNEMGTWQLKKYMNEAKYVQFLIHTKKDSWAVSQGMFGAREGNDRWITVADSFPCHLWDQWIPSQAQR